MHQWSLESGQYTLYKVFPYRISIQLSNPCGDLAGLFRGGAGAQPAGLRLQPEGREGVQHGPVHPAAG